MDENDIDRQPGDDRADDRSRPLSTPENQRWGLIFLGIVAAVLVYLFILSPLLNI